MKYALNLSEDYHILSASFCNKFTPEDAIRVDALPEGNIIDYKYINGEYVYVCTLKILDDRKTVLWLVKGWHYDEYMRNGAWINLHKQCY